MAYEFTSQVGDGEALLQVLHRGVTAREQEARGLKDGTLSASAVMRDFPEWLRSPR